MSAKFELTELPFYRDQIQSYSYGYSNTVPCPIFEATLTFQHMSRGRSSAVAIWEDPWGGKHSMFMSDLADVLKKGVRKGGKAKATWTYVKKGQNYGICLFEEKETN